MKHSLPMTTQQTPAGGKEYTRTFAANGDFVAFDMASAFLRERGFSLGSMQRDDPIGVMFGDFCIAKWRNMSERELGKLHGQITGSKRHGPVHVTLFSNAPDAAFAAIAAATGEPK